ncbi:MAG TPA: ACT domain-containing protein [Acidimicrobiales bacterium]|nr:ACT domain-containing protein [Acidimicrobiales bacterium]
MATELAITAVGADRPGVVAGVTGALAALDCNLEDTSMTILRGRFAMVLIVRAPSGVDRDAVEAALAAPAAELGLDVSVRPSAAATADVAGAPWNLAVYGADRPGSVHRVTAALADVGVNIVDLTTRVIGDPAHPVYAMLLEVVVPDDVAVDALRDRLGAVAAELGVEWSMHESDADVL